jgi:predicted secreted Zn-dependent protease
MVDGLGGKLVWHRGTACEGGACVEVATASGTVMVRSSADPQGTPITLTRDEWREFVTGVKEGDFDHV